LPLIFLTKLERKGKEPGFYSLDVFDTLNALNIGEHLALPEKGCGEKPCHLSDRTKRG
jgi:hypothetical protein